MISIFRVAIASCLAMACACTTLAGVPATTSPGQNFDGTMSVIYNNLNGDVFLENSPNPNPSIANLKLTSFGSLLLPGNLAVPPANVVTATPSLIELSGPGNFLGTGSFLGSILGSGYSQIQLLTDLSIQYNGSTLGDLIYGSFGQLQAQPLVPTAPCCRFFSVASGQFFDPPMASGYTYTMDSASTFTKIGLPIGLGNDFTITSSQGTVSNLPENGQHVFSGLGVSSFTLTGISPPVDPDDPAAFPAYLEFSTPEASFTMSPVLVPEPSTVMLVGIALFGALVGRRR